MAMIAVPYAIASGSHSAELFRDALQAMVSGTGVVGSSDLQVTAHSPANMSVNVGVGQVVVPGTLGATGVFPNNLNYQGYTGNVQPLTQQGCYYAYNNSVINLTIAAADPTNPRIDLVVVSDPDAQYSGSSNTPVLQVITGTPAPSPSAPTCPASSVVLAQVAVAANASSISSGNITDKRPYLALTAPERGNPAGRCYLTANYSGASPIPMTGSSFTYGGMTVANSGLTVPIAGAYAVFGAYTIAVTGAGFVYASIVNNGTGVSTGTQSYTPSAGNMLASVADLVQCAAGAVLKLGFATSVGGTFQAGTTATYLSAALVSQ